MIFLAFNILTSGVPFSMVCAVIALAAAFFLIAAVVRSPSGNQRMREISGAIQEGAKAYLNRQVITISSIAVIIFILLFIFKDRPTAIGFMIGAFCSLSAGYIGMRIAVGPTQYNPVASRWMLSGYPGRLSMNVSRLPRFGPVSHRRVIR